VRITKLRKVLYALAAVLLAADLLFAVIRALN
jgi:hypothetical protein